jgi:hypothetical protein
MIMNKNTRPIFGFCVMALLVVACTGGGGDTDGGSANDLANDYGDGAFVDDENSAGKIEVEVVEPELQVALTSGFFARVYDAAGAPVPNIRIACDSEEGVAILEPTSGFETTDSGGAISGRIGCEVPGSYLFGCRLPVGGNKRKFVTVKCQGPIPNGFTGFPGAGGGGLGGGTASGNDGGVGGVDPSGVRITDISVSDRGTGEGTSSIDTVISDCDTDPTTFTAEPFFDTSATFKVVNNSNRTIRFTELRYRVPNASGSGTSSFTSSPVRFIGEALPNGAEATFSQIIIFNAEGLGKSFNGAGANIPSNLGFRNVTFELTGETDIGESVTITGSEALSFDNYNNCGS